MLANYQFRSVCHAVATKRMAGEAEKKVLSVMKTLWNG